MFARYTFLGNNVYVANAWNEFVIMDMSNSENSVLVVDMF